LLEHGPIDGAPARAGDFLASVRNALDAPAVAA